MSGRPCGTSNPKTQSRCSSCGKHPVEHADARPDRRRRAEPRGRRPEQHGGQSARRAEAEEGAEAEGRGAEADGGGAD